MRRSGILLPISSLPSPYGIGRSVGQRIILLTFLQRRSNIVADPASGPTGFGDSPYQSFSTFAGNPSLIDLDNLVSWTLAEDEINSLIGVDCPYGLITA